MECLSAGLRVDRAGDDVAGFVIGDKMRTAGGPPNETHYMRTWIVDFIKGSLRNCRCETVSESSAKVVLHTNECNFYEKCAAGSKMLWFF